MEKETIEQLKQKLQKEKVSIEEELQSFAKKDKDIKGNWDTKFPNRENGSMEEEADEAQEYDNLLSVEYNLELRLKDINLALGKIEKGGYGKCEKCGKEIEEERLLAYPEARLCIKCNKNS